MEPAGRLDRRDLLAALVFLLCAVAFLGDTLFAGRALLPTDNLFAAQPWRALAGQAGVGLPHNELISDMVLQNLPWKTFAAESLRAGQPPLWNPGVFAGVPFLAAGQPGALYPLGALFYIMPPERAYAWFTALHLCLGALFTYLYLRVIGGGRVGGVVAGLAFAFSGFVVVSFIWPMVLGVVVWLPLLLALAELVVRSQEAPGRGRAGLLVALGGLVVGVQFLGGHMEMSFYTLFSLAFYSAARLAISLSRGRRLGPPLRAGLLLAAMVAIGTAAAGAQILPFYEVIGRNYRAAGWTTYEQVVGYALPKKQALGFLVPDLYGNPSRHTYFDFSQLREVPIPDNSLGQPTSPPQTVFWGVKNYVEASGYVGVLPLVLALLALLLARNRYTAIFAAYAVWSFLLIIGTPLYAVLYFGIPGFEQLQTPFRWVYPYTLSVAVLAGLGASVLGRLRPSPRGAQASPPSPVGKGAGGKGAGGGGPLLLARLVGLAALAAGVVILLGLALALVFPDRVVAVADAFVRGNAAAAGALSGGRMLLYYEARNVGLFAALLAASGGVVYLAGRARAWPALAVLLLAADLFAFGYGFNSRTDSGLLARRPGVVDFLAADPGLFRIVSFGEEDVLKPNLGMLYGLQDARGYDTIIPRQYVDYWRLIEPPAGLQYNQINKLVRAESLASPYLDLLNVKYVLTTQALNAPGLRLVYDGEVRVYERATALPRAFLVPAARFVEGGPAALEALRAPGLDLRREVVLEGPGTPVAGSGGEAVVESYGGNEVVARTRSPGPAYLVLADSWFPGWQASVDGQPAELYRADANFRAVAVPAGEHRVVFKYSPMSLKVGLFVSLIGLAVAALLLGIAAWQRLAGGAAEPGTARRVGRNSVAPMATSLLNKLVDFAFAMLMLRLLGPENVGRFTFAVVVIGYLDILTNFGLNALLIREVARAPEARHRYLTGSVVLRLGLWVVVVPLALALLYLGRGPLGVDRDTLLVIAILGLSLGPGNVAGALSSLFNAFERLEHPAALAVATNLLRIALGAAALLAGWGIVGLAGVSLLVNLATAAAFAVLAVRVLGRSRLELQPRLLREMLGSSYPLMLNHLLATIFFKVDSVLLKWLAGDAVLGYYATAYKFVDGLQVIPSSFVFAIFPLMSRRAGEGAESLRRAYVLALRILVGLALPIAVVTTAVAEPLVLLLGGSAYLPHAAIALQVLIWFLPFSFVNGVTQYVLIAIDQQRFITRSFVVATAFNVAANLVAIPRFGYVGAAVVTILSELALLGPFHYCARRHLGPVPLLSLLARPGLAAAGMAALLWAGRGLSPLLLLPASGLLYLGLLVVAGAVTPEELALGWRAVGGRLARWRAPRAAGGRPA